MATAGIDAHAASAMLRAAIDFSSTSTVPSTGARAHNLVRASFTIQRKETQKHFKIALQRAYDDSASDTALRSPE